MKSFKDFYLAEQEIDYNVNNSTTLARRNLDVAKSLLQKNKEFVDYINNNAEDIEELDTEEQRDLATAAWIVVKKDPEFAREIGLEIKEPEIFQDSVKNEIIDPTRIAANKLQKKNPTIKEAQSGGESTAEPEKKEAPKSEPKAPAKQETPAKPNEPEEDEPAGDELDQAIAGKDEPAESGRTGTGVDKEKFPEPAKIAKEIEDIKSKTIEDLEQIRDTAKNREKVASVDRQIKKVSSRLDKLINDAERAQKAYTVSPTRSSQLRGSTKAKQALNKAETESKVAINNAGRKQLDSAITRGAKRVKEAGEAVGKGIKKVADSRAVQTSKEALKRGAEVAAPAIKRGASLAKEKIGQATSRVKENMQARSITDSLGAEKAKQYAEALRVGDTTTANKIAAEAARKKQEEAKTARAQRMSNKATQRENQALRRQSAGTGTSRTAQIAKKVTDRFRRPA